MILKSALAALTLVIAMTAGAMAQAVPQPDNQGWGGPSWYVSGGGSSLAVGPYAEPAWILFNGPHAQQSACLETSGSEGHAGCLEEAELPESGLLSWHQ